MGNRSSTLSTRNDTKSFGSIEVNGRSRNWIRIRKRMGRMRVGWDNLRTSRGIEKRTV